IIIFLVIKFVLFPVLTLLTGSSLPLVVVESSSMSHHAVIFGEFDNWWNSEGSWYTSRNIANLSSAKSWPLKSGFEKGDIIMLVGVSPEKVRIGDVIVFNAYQKNPIIHRVVNISVMDDGSLVFSTKGDNNYDQIPQDNNILGSNILGKALIKIPKVGWIKLFVVNFMSFFH
ncbi:signal peptidase I, partial [Candidatus Pacearchaeota archaeon CG10_big_fil_rev_8_21_14_0_10_35_13]